MVAKEIVLHTAGDGLWSGSDKAVVVMGFAVDYISEDEKFGELRVYFDIDSWDCDVDGLIYTDSGFKSELAAWLASFGLDASDVDYSEAGMQGDNFVSFDVGADFLASYKERFAEAYAEVYGDCNE